MVKVPANTLVPFPKSLIPKQGTTFAVVIDECDAFESMISAQKDRIFVESQPYLLIKDEKDKSRRYAFALNEDIMPGYSRFFVEIDFVKDYSLSYFFTALARTVNLPGETLNEVEIPGPYTSFFVGGKMTADTFSITFVDIATSPLYRYFRSWVRAVTDTVSLSMGVPTTYMANVGIVEFVWTIEGGQPVPVPLDLHLFEGSFPTSIAGYTADITSDDVVTFDVTFRFSRKILDREMYSDYFEKIVVLPDGKKKKLLDVIRESVKGAK